MSDEEKATARRIFERGKGTVPLDMYRDWFEGPQNWIENPSFCFFAAEFYLKERGLLKDESTE